MCRTSYWTCLEKWGVKSVCPWLRLHPMDTFLPPLFVLCFQLRQTSPQSAWSGNSVKLCSKIFNTYSFILQVRKDGQECICKDTAFKMPLVWPYKKPPCHLLCLLLSHETGQEKCQQASHKNEIVWRLKPPEIQEKNNQHFDSQSRTNIKGGGGVLQASRNILPVQLSTS